MDRFSGEVSKIGFEIIDSLSGKAGMDRRRPDLFVFGSILLFCTKVAMKREEEANMPQPTEMSEDRYRQFSGPLRILVKAIAAGICLYCLLMASGYLAYFKISYIPLQLNAIFLGAVLVSIFLLIPLTKRSRKDRLPWYDIVLALAALAGNGYIAVNALDLMGVLHLSATPLEIVLGLITFVLILEAVRRVLGWPMVAMGLFFFLYLKFGSYVPGMWRAYPLPWPLAMSNIYTSTQGHLRSNSTDRKRHRNRLSHVWRCLYICRRG